MVFEEPDERFWVGVGLTRSERYLVISTSSKLTSEDWLLDAADPGGQFRSWRRAGRASSTASSTRCAADGTDRLLILHNDGRRELRAGRGAAGRPGGLDAARAPPRRHPAARGRRLRRPPGRLPAQGRADRAADAAGRRERAARSRSPSRSTGCRPGEPRVPRAALPARLRLAGDARLGVRLRHGDRRADPAAAPPGAAPAGRSGVRPGRLRAAPAVGDRTGRHPGPDLAGLPRGTAARRPGAVRAVRVRQLRDPRSTRASPSPACPCWTGASAMRSRMSAAGASWGGGGTTTARC